MNVKLDASCVTADSFSALLENTPEALLSLGNAEEYTRQDYTDRFVFELLQNARDAAARGGTKAPRVLLLVRGNALVVANDGAPFDLDGYRALTGIGRSTKTDVLGAHGEALIGRKGIGFKSVLRVSAAPQVFGNTAERGRLSLAFGRPAKERVDAGMRGDHAAFVETLRQDEREAFDEWRNGRELASYSLPCRVGATNGSQDWTKLPTGVAAMMFPHWVPYEQVPALVKDLLGWSEAGCTPYTTVVYLPLEAANAEEVGKKLKADVVAEKVLFLGVLEHVRVEIDEEFVREIRVDRSKAGIVELTVDETGQPPGQHRYRLFDRDVDVPGDNEKRKVLVAVPVDAAGHAIDRGRFPLYNYYPIVDEGARLLPILAHAEFEVDPGRKSMSDDHMELNEALAEALADLLAGHDGVWSAVVERGEIEARSSMPGLLIPSKSERSLPSLLRQRVLEHLKDKRCVPVRDGWAVAREVIDAHGPVGDALRRLVPIAYGILVSERDGDDALLALCPRPWDTSALTEVLDRIDTSGCSEEGPFRDLYEIIQNTIFKGRELFLDKWRVGKPCPKAIVPCRSPDGGVVGVVPPQLNKAGEQMEQNEEVLYLRTGSAGAICPPAAMRVRFVLDELSGVELFDWRDFCQNFFGVRQFALAQILGQVGSVKAAREEDWADVARFVLGLLRAERSEPWQLGDHASTDIAPEKYFAGMRDLQDRPARRGLAAMHLPDAGGQLRAGPDLRFNEDWGAQYGPLDDFGPESVNLLAAPDDLVKWLGADTTKEEALALARLCGVWETAPVGWLEERTAGVSLSDIESRMPDDAHRAWAKGIASKQWIFGGKDYAHGEVKVTRTAWLRDLPSSDPSRSQALLKLLDRDWEFFEKLGKTELVCPACKGKGKGTSNRLHSRLYSGEKSPPLALHSVLNGERWYYLQNAASHAGPVKLSEMVLVDKPPKDLHSSRWQFVPHPSQAEASALKKLGVLPISDIGLEPLLLLLQSLRAKLEKASELQKAPYRAAFVSLHRDELYPRLAQLVPDRPVAPDLVARINAIGWLAETHNGLVHVSASKAFIDAGNDPVGRTRFRSKATFHIAADSAVAKLTEALGARKFLVIATPHEIGKRDVTESFRQALIDALPEIVALVSRVVPGGGQPPDVETDEFGKRVKRLLSIQFFHCEDLSVDLEVDGTDLVLKGIGARQQRDHFLEEHPSSPPVLWFDHPMNEPTPETLLPELSGELARAFGVPAHGPLFALLLQRDSEKRETWLEDLGVTVEDIDRAKRALGVLSADGQETALQLWSALVKSAPPSNDKNWASSIQSAAELIRGQLPAGAPSVDCWNLAASAVPILATTPEAWKSGRQDGVLARLVNAGWNLEELADILHAHEFRFEVNIQDHALALKELALRHGDTVEALLHHKGEASIQDKLSLAFAPQPADWCRRLSVPQEELLASLRKVLDEAKLAMVPLPRIGQTKKEWREIAAQAAEIEVSALFSLGTATPDSQAKLAARKREIWLPILVALLAEPGGRTDIMRSLITRTRDALRGPKFGNDVGAAAKAWLMNNDFGPHETDRVLSELLKYEEAGDTNAVLEIGRVAGVVGLPDRLRRVRQLLNEQRTKRLEALRVAKEALPVAEVQHIVPLAGSEVMTPGPKPPPARQRKILPGAVPEDQAERRRNAQLGERGEDVVFRWAAEQLIKLDRAEFSNAVREVHEWLCKRAPNLAEKFSPHLADALDSTADEEDVLLALERLLHVSGDRGSDEFGFDLVAWDVIRKKPIAIEVKTSTTLEAEFHLSARQWEVAEELADDFMIMRVALPKTGPASLVSLWNPTRLSKDVLSVDGEMWRCRLLGLGKAVQPAAQLSDCATIKQSTGQLAALSD